MAATRLASILLSIACLTSATAQQLRSEISQWSITWTFDREYPTGQFCNGDWWVAGPVVVVRIDPPTEKIGGRQLHGSMVNPTINGDQGYDSVLYAGYAPQRFKPWLNVGNKVPSLMLQPGTSLISTISQIGPHYSGSASQMKTAAVLTVLDSIPSADAFRPPYSGADKSIRHRAADILYDRLLDVVPAAGAPQTNSMEQSFERVWLDHCDSWVGRYLHPAENMPDYYRDFTTLYGTGALLMNCNATDQQKRKTLIGMIQIGIDHFGNMQNGARWGVNGHCNGRKFPILFAGAMLGDKAMAESGIAMPTLFFGPGDPRNTAVAPFSEDGQTFYVEETSPGVFNWGHGNYNASHRGMAEWGNFHTENPATDTSAWNGTPYRICCSANGWVGQTLAMRMMGLQFLWAQPAYFDYQDRYMATEPPGWTRAWDPWHAAMWDMHRPSY